MHERDTQGGERTRVAHERVLVRGRLLQALDELRVLVLELRRVGLLDPVRAVKAVGDRTAFM